MVSPETLEPVNESARHVRKQLLTALLLVVGAMALVVAFEIADDLALSRQLSSGSVHLALGPAVWTHVGYGLLGAVFLELGLCAVLGVFAPPADLDSSEPEGGPTSAAALPGQDGLLDQHDNGQPEAKRTSPPQRGVLRRQTHPAQPMKAPDEGESPDPSTEGLRCTDLE